MFSLLSNMPSWNVRHLLLWDTETELERIE